MTFLREPLTAARGWIARGWIFGALIVCVLLAAPVASASRPTPPSAASFRQATRALMETPPFSSPTGPTLRSGGLGPGGPTSPGGGGLFPKKQLLTLYGAPQLSATVLGKLGPNAAARKVVKQVKPYARLSNRKVIPGFDLIAVVANSTPGRDKMYRTRQPDSLIKSYLKAVRSVDGRLVLDIQPGRAKVLDEINALEPWIAKPDVDVSIDPEWNVGPHGVPGSTTGKISAKNLNKVSLRIQGIIDAHNLPPKALVIHQFRSGSVRDRGALKQRKGVDVTLSFDGIGSPAAKKAGYKNLTSPAAFNGFSIFYSLDTRIMSAASVLGLRPSVNFLLFQ